MADSRKLGCGVCRREPEPGYIEMENNGPIVPCWICNREEWLAALRKDVKAAVREAMTSKSDSSP